MYGHLLIATDGSELAWKAVEHGLALAKKLNARVTAITVTQPLAMMMGGQPAVPIPVDEYEKAIEANAAKTPDPNREEAKKYGVSCETLHVKDHYPAEGILEAAKGRGPRSHRHGAPRLAKLLLGSQATEVLTRSPMPVLICR